MEDHHISAILKVLNKQELDSIGIKHKTSLEQKANTYTEGALALAPAPHLRPDSCQPAPLLQKASLRSSSKAHPVITIS